MLASSRPWRQRARASRQGRGGKEERVSKATASTNKQHRAHREELLERAKLHHLANDASKERQRNDQVLLWHPLSPLACSRILQTLFNFQTSCQLPLYLFLSYASPLLTPRWMKPPTWPTLKGRQREVMCSICLSVFPIPVPLHRLGTLSASPSSLSTPAFHSWAKAQNPLPH
jgi:hypothetical protein